mgnify:CR=1 FL=1
MIFNQVLGNIDDINDLNNLHIEKIYIIKEVIFFVEYNVGWHKLNGR